MPAPEQPRIGRCRLRTSDPYLSETRLRPPRCNRSHRKQQYKRCAQRISRSKEMTNMRITKRRTAGVLGAILALGAAAAVVVMTAGGASGAGSKTGTATALPRSQTFYMSGNQ